MLRKIAFAAVAGALTLGAAVPAQAYTPYEQCLIDHCIGKYQGNPVGYRMCSEWCARTYGGPQFAPASLDPVKLD